jgi:hypothetical protein
LTSLQQRLIKTGGRLVKHARYRWLLAEGPLTRERFEAMCGESCCCHSQRAKPSDRVVGANLLKVRRMGAVSDKSTWNDVDYPAKSRRGAAWGCFALRGAVLACKVTPGQ